ncbi:nitric oxide synthase [Xylaria palmicola]|nr:nitric oxide synthase [Xylaria palmicola]
MASKESSATLDRRKLLILYGSETGNSEDCANDIECMARRLRFHTLLEEMDSVELGNLLQYSLVVFVVSTTGQGDLPKNARKFWKSLLRKRLPPNCLRQVSFATFGLGDSSYLQYNWAARKLHKRLEQLGAVEFLPRGEADERHEDGIDGTFLPWCLTLRTYLEKNYPLPLDLLPIPTDIQLPPKFTLEFVERGRATDGKDGRKTNGKEMSDDSAMAACDAESNPPPSLLPVPDSWTCIVHGNTPLTPSSHWQDVRLLSIRAMDKLNETTRELSSLSYCPGDVAVIYPKNFPRDVQALIDLMGWGDVADKQFRHVTQNTELPYQTPKNCYLHENSTLRDILVNNYDITSIPRRIFFTQIAYYTEDPTHIERLREFADPVHSDEFWDYTSRPRRSILEVLQDFPSVRIPYQHVPTVFPVMRGREYSIASIMRPSADGVSLDLLVALVKYKTVLRKTRQGVCSRYISSLKPNTPINITVRTNSIPAAFRDPSAYLLAIAPGTGIAPIRALIQERAAATRGKNSENMDKIVLFFGGRNRNADFFFEEEWRELGIKVSTAFSRDQPSKIYVQDRLLEQYALVSEWIANGATICLCGSSGKMPEAVRLALYDCMVKGGLATDREHAKAIFHDKVMFWEEVW